MRIVVGLSGGVDSSVAALKLVEQGHEVIGLFMRNWHDQSVTISDDCPWIDDSNDAMLVAEHLGISLVTKNLTLLISIILPNQFLSSQASTPLI